MSNSGHLDFESPLRASASERGVKERRRPLPAACTPIAPALPGIRPVVAIVAADLMPRGEGLSVQRLCSKQLRTSASLECGSVAVRTRRGISLGVIRMAADPRLPDCMHAVRTASAGHRERARVAYAALGHSAGIPLQVGAVHGIVGLICRELGVLRSVASRAFRRTVSLAEPVQTEASGWGVRSGGKPRIGARTLRSSWTDVSAGESS